MQRVVTHNIVVAMRSQAANQWQRQLATGPSRKTGAKSAIIPPAMVMVAPAPLMAWWQMAGRVVRVLMKIAANMAGQAAPGTQVDPELAT